jgi:glycosyltransferase involved in cell wall biosynthesis
LSGLLEDGSGATAQSGAVAFVLKGYPRLSETFIAQEIAELERLGLDIRIVALRHPTDKRRHPIHSLIRASVDYLPEYLWREPVRVLRAWWHVRRWPSYRQARRVWLADLRRDLTPNRVRRFGQALVLARELPQDVRRLHAHFLHTPASVVRYAAVLRGIKWTASAHAKDIWTTPQWELREKLASCEWLVTCTAANAAYLAPLAPPGRVELAYHGLDLSRFALGAVQGSQRTGVEVSDPVLILSVGRMVEKKGTDVLLEALACLPPQLHWQLIHVGGGPLGRALRKRAAALGLTQRIRWLGALPQDELLEEYRRADLFALACRIADDGDRDGLPNVLMEAQSQGLACVATDVSAVRELIEDGVNGLLVQAERPRQFALALERLVRSPDLRRALGQAGQARVASQFAMQPNIARLAQKFGLAA